MNEPLNERIARDREIMEHATMALVGLDFLGRGMEDETILLDEFSSLGPDWGDQHDAIYEQRSALVWIIGRKAADVYRLGNGLPMPPDERTEQNV